MRRILAESKPAIVFEINNAIADLRSGSRARPDLLLSDAGYSLFTLSGRRGLLSFDASALGAGKSDILAIHGEDRSRQQALGSLLPR